jgi:prepilin-type N-terminal cleavage/methylation domain-containing protein
VGWLISVYNFVGGYNYTMKSPRGFTLIELLVVIAIIGLLSSVILASLSSARAKARAAAIAGNLRNMIPAAEMALDATGNYSTASTSVVKILTAISGASVKTYFFSWNNPGYSDVYLRYGASAIDYNATPPVKAWSVSQAGQVTWDAKGVNSSGVFVGTDVTMTWDQANTACALSGGRLPTAEEAYTLSQATFLASGSYTPPGFVASRYWSSTTVPSNSAWAYVEDMTDGGIPVTGKSSTFYVRCVR